MKRYGDILLAAAFLAIQLPANAQREKTLAGTAQKRKPAIDTATWQAFDLGAYTFERRLPLTVKLPVTAKLKKKRCKTAFTIT